MGNGSKYDSAIMTALSSSRRHGPVRLEDVARRAGVSPITVSRALREGTVVAKTTRERVLAAAEQLGYTPNLLARGLVKNRTATVGVVIVEVANPTHPFGVRGVVKLKLWPQLPVLPSIRFNWSCSTSFVIGGVSDSRDVRANREGQRFALALMTDLSALPSAWLAGGTGIRQKEDP